jgi:hypothetical protein
MIEVQVGKDVMMEFTCVERFQKYLHKKFLDAGIPVNLDGTFSRVGSCFMSSDPLAGVTTWRWYEAHEAVPDDQEYMH